MEEDENIKIEKFIYAAPPIGKNFSYNIFRTKEYHDNKLGPIEDTNVEKGTPLLSQKLASIFFSEHTQYQNGLFYHEPGTGKTCLSSFIIENFKNTLVDDSPRKPALIIVPNETLEKNYRKDIANQCTIEGTYEGTFTQEEINKMLEMNEIKQLSDLTIERRLKIAVSKTYEIVTHEAFLTTTLPDLKVPSNINAVQSEYSNRIIVIDEAHNFRLQTATGEGKKRKETALHKASGKDPGVTIELYKKLHDFLHILKGCRVLLLTGTPIWDQVDEIATLLNLILDMDSQLPIKKDFLKEFFDKDRNIIPEKAIELKNKIRGMVSFLRPMMSTARREEIGVTKPLLERIKIYPSAMSDFQYKNYQEAFSKVTVSQFTYTTKTGEKVKLTREIEGGPMRLLARDASTFVFPIIKGGVVVGGTYGQDGFKDNIVKNPKTGYFYKSKEVAAYIKNNLKEVSSKFYSIVELIKQNPNELVFIYDEYVAAGGGGLINLALVLRELGFVWVKSAAGISKKDPQGRKRFCVISSDTETLHNPKQIQDFINSFNKEDNKYGDRCQIIIGSRKIAEGITIKNIRQGHIIMPHWNIPSLDQALGRIFRVGSHDAFNEDEKYVKIYKHVSLQSGDNVSDSIKLEIAPGNIKLFSKQETLDLTIYKLAEQKEFYNTQIYRILKEVSWDCPLTYERNVLKSDENFTRSTDYLEKNFKCHGFPDKYIDKSGDVWKYEVPDHLIVRDTYDLFYNSSEIVDLIVKIRNIFQSSSNIHFNTLLKLLELKKEDDFLLLKTLDYLISSRTKLKNMYGFDCLLNEKGDMYFLDDDVYSISPSYEVWSYSEFPLVAEYKSLEELSNINQYISDKQNIKNFCKNPSVENVKKLNYKTSIILLEEIYNLSTTALSSGGGTLTTSQKKAIESVLSVLGKNLYVLERGDAIHVMYNTEYTGLGYNVALQEIKPNGKMRVYNIKKKKWSFVGSIEEEENYIKNIKLSEKSKVEEDWGQYPLGIYGYKDKKGKFKIKVKPDEGQKMTRGSVCLEASWGIPRLYNVMNNINALPDPHPDFENLPRNKLISIITGQQKFAPFWESLNQKSDKELRQILTLNKMDKKELCSFLEGWFKKKGYYQENI